MCTSVIVVWLPQTWNDFVTLEEILSHQTLVSQISHFLILPYHLYDTKIDQYLSISGRVRTDRKPHFLIPWTGEREFSLDGMLQVYKVTHPIRSTVNLYWLRLDLKPRIGKEIFGNICPEKPPTSKLTLPSENSDPVPCFIPNYLLTILFSRREYIDDRDKEHYNSTRII